MRRLNACHSLLQCVLKFFNMLLALVGAAMILYALWMLNQWLHTHPSAEAPAPNGFPSMVLDLGGVGSEAMKEGRLWETDQIAGISAGFQIALGSLKLPAPWFIYCFLGIGIAVCLITCFGRIAIETNNGCCLSSYCALIILLILLQVASAVDIFVNKHWEKTIPDDPTGEFDEIKSFVMDNFDFCKWIGITVVVVEALSVLLALSLRIMIPNSPKTDYDSDDDDYILPRSGTCQTLLNHQITQGNAQNAAATDTRSTGLDTWSTRMREKYQLYTKEFS